MKYDKIVGFWIYNRPYLWIPNKDYKKCRRLYLCFYDEKIYSSTKRIVKFSGKINTNSDVDYNSYSMISIYEDEYRNMTCDWGRNYFQVFVSARDMGRLLRHNQANVRINGNPIDISPFINKHNRELNVVSLLKRYGFYKRGNTMFGKNYIKIPEWTTHEQLQKMVDINNSRAYNYYFEKIHTKYIGFINRLHAETEGKRENPAKLEIYKKHLLLLNKEEEEIKKLREKYGNL